MTCCSDAIFRAELCMFQGVDWFQALSWKPGGGDPVDLTGYTGVMTIRANNDSPIIETLSTNTGEIELGLFTLAATTTEPEYQYNIRLMLDRSRVSAIPYGSYKGLLLIEGLTDGQIPPASFDIKVNQLP